MCSPREYVLETGAESLREAVESRLICSDAGEAGRRISLGSVSTIFSVCETEGFLRILKRLSIGLNGPIGAVDGR